LVGGSTAPGPPARGPLDPPRMDSSRWLPTSTTQRLFSPPIRTAWEDATTSRSVRRVPPAELTAGRPRANEDSAARRPRPGRLRSSSRAAAASPGPRRGRDRAPLGQGARRVSARRGSARPPRRSWRIRMIRD
jgi:hypothetical protein